jgi:hypothetical protein
MRRGVVELCDGVGCGGGPGRGLGAPGGRTGCISLEELGVSVMSWRGA